MKKTYAAILFCVSVALFGLSKSTDHKEIAPEETNVHHTEVIMVSNPIKNGWYNNYFYKNNKKYTGIHHQLMFVKGQVFSGTYKKTLYSRGKKYTGFNAGLYFENGKLFTGRSRLWGYTLNGQELPLYLYKGKIANGYYDFFNEGIKRYYSKGIQAEGFYKIKGEEIFFEHGLPGKSGFVKDFDVDYYIVNGKKYTGFIKHYSTIFYFKKGINVKGMFSINDLTFIADPISGKIMTGLIHYKESYYYANPSGVLYKDTFYKNFLIDKNGVILNYPEHANKE